MYNFIKNTRYFVGNLDCVLSYNYFLTTNYFGWKDRKAYVTSLITGNELSLTCYSDENHGNFAAKGMAATMASKQPSRCIVIELVDVEGFEIKHQGAGHYFVRDILTKDNHFPYSIESILGEE